MNGSNFRKNGNTSNRKWGNITPTQCFSRGLLELLETHNLKEITLSRVSDACGYGRATFYRYFDDFYDLLSKCWSSLGLDFRVNAKELLEAAQWALAMFDRLFMQLESSSRSLAAIARRNPPTGRVGCSLNCYLEQGVLASEQRFLGAAKRSSQAGVVSLHVARTIAMMLTCCFYSDEPLLRKEAEHDLLYLLRTVTWDMR